jgi:hypothetical protein
MIRDTLLVPTNTGWRKSHLVPTGPIRQNRRRPRWRWFAAGLAIGCVLGASLAVIAKP